MMLDNNRLSVTATVMWMAKPYRLNKSSKNCD